MASKQLLLLRHAKSDWDSGVADDFARPLSPRGRRDAPAMGRWLAENGYAPQRIVASPSARTVETVELVRDALREAGHTVPPEEVVTEQRLYHGGGEAIGCIAAEHLSGPGGVGRLLVVAHNPGMEAALLDYCPDAEAFADGKYMPTCALAVIELDAAADPADEKPRLSALMRPSML